AHRRVLPLPREASTPEAWHEVRKAAKTLPYLPERIPTLLPPDEAARAIPTLKRCPRARGATQDAGDRVEPFRAAADDLVAAGAAPAQHRAVGALIERSLARGRIAYAACEGRFERFASKASRRRFAELVEHVGENGPPGGDGTGDAAEPVSVP